VTCSQLLAVTIPTQQQSSIYLIVLWFDFSTALILHCAQATSWMPTLKRFFINSFWACARLRKCFLKIKVSLPRHRQRPLFSQGNSRQAAPCSRLRLTLPTKRFCPIKRLSAKDNRPQLANSRLGLTKCRH
jgi:hypothetical protein